MYLKNRVDGLVRSVRWLVKKRMLLTSQEHLWNNLHNSGKPDLCFFRGRSIPSLRLNQFQQSLIVVMTNGAFVIKKHCRAVSLGVGFPIWQSGMIGITGTCELDPGLADLLSEYICLGSSTSHFFAPRNIIENKG